MTFDEQYGEKITAAIIELRARFPNLDYVDFGPSKSRKIVAQLDGRYSPTELRHIADMLEQLCAP